jgi:hypothetical protein
MVKAIVNIDERANRIISIVKAKEDLRDKSDVINLIIDTYGKEFMEPELRPEFIKELLEAQKEKTVKVKDFGSHYR